MALQKKVSNKVLLCGWFTLFGCIIFCSFANTSLINNILGQQKANPHHQLYTTLASIPHNAKGHAAHQVVNFVNPIDDNIYKGTVKFNSSVPVDIISYTKLKDQQNINPKTKVWDVDNVKYAPNTLLKNVTGGTVNFNASGILAHNEKGQHYKVTFTINDTIGGSLTLASIPHNAKGHAAHQVVNFVNPIDDNIYKGTVKFNSSVPVDIILSLN